MGIDFVSGLSNGQFMEFLNGLLENPYMGIIFVDKEGYIRLINDTYLELLGRKRKDVEGKHVCDITPASRLPEVIQTGEAILADFWPVNGHKTIVARIPLRGLNGDIIGAVGKSLFLDISGAKSLITKLQQVEKELNIYKEEIRNYHTAGWAFSDLIGSSPNFMKKKQLAEQLSFSTSSVLIYGESGTGKELFAHAIHNNGPRSNGPFVRVNCAAIPESLLESELFGYEEGAFTGAKKGGKPGKFELANHGTIFLDEIGDMLLVMQTKLLSVLQERVIERVGGTQPIPVDVRVIAATNRNIDEMVTKGEFRPDLYYRLNVIRLNIPPLRKRLDDLPDLVDNLILKINDRLGTNVKGISDDAIKRLISYDWPGNVRELENQIERAINLADMSQDKVISLKHLPNFNRSDQISHIADPGQNVTMSEAVCDLEKQMIINALEQTGGNKALAAKMLGLHSSLLYRKLEKYGI